MRLSKTSRRIGPNDMSARSPSGSPTLPGSTAASLSVTRGASASPSRSPLDSAGTTPPSATARPTTRRSTMPSDGVRMFDPLHRGGARASVSPIASPRPGAAPPSRGWVDPLPGAWGFLPAGPRTRSSRRPTARRDCRPPSSGLPASAPPSPSRTGISTPRTRGRRQRCVPMAGWALPLSSRLGRPMSRFSTQARICLRRCGPILAIGPSSWAGCPSTSGTRGRWASGYGDMRI